MTSTPDGYHDVKRPTDRFQRSVAEPDPWEEDPELTASFKKAMMALVITVIAFVAGNYPPPA